MNNINEFIDEIVLVTPDLTEDFTYVLVKTKLTEEQFLAKLSAVAGVRPLPVKTPWPEYRIPLAGSSPLLKTPRAFVCAFLAPGIVVLAKDSLARFRAFRYLGLRTADRKRLLTPGALAVGFIQPDPEFLLNNPLIPPIDRLEHSWFVTPDGSLRVSAVCRSADEAAAQQVLLMARQMIILGAAMLNNQFNDPALTQEWNRSFTVKQNQTEVRLEGSFSKSLITRLADAAGPAAGNSPQKTMKM